MRFFPGAHTQRFMTLFCVTQGRHGWFDARQPISTLLVGGAHDGANSRTPAADA